MLQSYKVTQSYLLTFLQALTWALFTPWPSRRVAVVEIVPRHGTWKRDYEILSRVLGIRQVTSYKLQVTSYKLQVS